MSANILVQVKSHSKREKKVKLKGNGFLVYINYDSLYLVCKRAQDQEVAASFCTVFQASTPRLVLMRVTMLHSAILFKTIFWLRKSAYELFNPQFF